MISVCKNANGSVTTIQYVKFEMEKKNLLNRAIVYPSIAPIS